MPPSDPSDDVDTLLRAEAGATSGPCAHDLVVTDGPDRGQRVRLRGNEPSRVLLGQGVACAFRLTDKEVSRRHAAIDTGERDLRLYDLGSKNGTFVDNVRVVECYLFDGQVLRMGGTTLRLEPAPEETGSSGVAPRSSFGRVVGASQVMLQLYPFCERLALADIPIVIEGETGTGKEVLAEAIHEASPRAAGRFAVFDCTTVAPTLVASALFGHERGAFTGATSTFQGVFEQADGGTLFIDEIGDLDLSLQPKLLRALQRGEIQRVGGDRWLHVDVRVMAATRRDLDREVLAGRFRDDLYYRLAVGRIELPPLRRRHGDVALLARHFWDRLGGATRKLPLELFDSFEDYAWPGNVRELENTIARCLALGDLAVDIRAERTEMDTADSKRDFLDKLVSQALPFACAREHMLNEFEQRYVGHMLQRHGGNVTRAAEAAGIARRYFHMLRAKGK